MRYRKYLARSENGKTDTAAVTRILDAAKRLFMEKGFRGTTTRDIAAEAGVTLGLIPYYFKTKENLAHKIAYDQMDRFYQSFDYGRMDALSSAEKIYALNLLIYERMFSDPAFGTLLFELSATTDVLDEPTDTFLQLSRKVIAEYNIQISDEENNFYVAAMMGSRKIPIQKYWRGEMKLHYTQIPNMIISNYLYNLGLPDEEIAQIITNGEAFCRALWREQGKRENKKK